MFLTTLENIFYTGRLVFFRFSAPSCRVHNPRSLQKLRVGPISPQCIRILHLKNCLFFLSSDVQNKGKPFFIASSTKAWASFSYSHNHHVILSVYCVGNPFSDGSKTIDSNLYFVHLTAPVIVYMTEGLNPAYEHSEIGKSQ